MDDITNRAHKIVKITISLLTILIVISGCSREQSLVLENATVDLRNDEERLGATGITSGEREGEFIVPIALSYDVVLKNTGKKKLGGMEKPNKEEFKYDDGIEVNIVPNEKLKEVSEEVMGFNIYNENENEFGIGQTSYPLLEPNQEGKYTFDFDLGALEENPELKLAPPIEQLEKLKEHAMDASLIVSIEGEEITRFDLSDLD